MSVQMTFATKSPGTTWLGTEMFEDSFGTMPYLIYITERTALKASITDTAPNISYSLTVTINILAGRPSWTAKTRERLKTTTGYRSTIKIGKGVNIEIGLIRVYAMTRSLSRTL
jgi:hypothetical protein